MTTAIDRSLCECKSFYASPGVRHCNNVASMIVVRENGNRELCCGRCTSSTDVIQARIDRSPERPPTRDVSKVRIDGEYQLGGKLYRVVEIAEEPNSGLVTVEEVGHSLSWRFQIPALWLVRDPGEKGPSEVALDAIDSLCDGVGWQHPGHVVQAVRLHLIGLRAEIEALRNEPDIESTSP